MPRPDRPVAGGLNRELTWKVGDKSGNQELGSIDLALGAEIDGEAVARALLAAAMPPRHDVVIDHRADDRGIELR